MPDPSAGGWIIHHVDYCPVWIGDEHLHALTPHRPHAENSLRLGSLENKENSLDCLFPGARRPSRVDEDASKQLLREIPMLRGRPAADVSWIKEFWNQHPWVREDLLLRDRIKRDPSI